jgi:type VI protein secretion system component Hcp
MAKGDSTDILMKFVLDGVAIAGQSTSELSAPGTTPNKLLTGFAKKAMFELDSFTFAVGLEDNVPGGQQQGGQQPGAHATGAQAATAAGGRLGAAGAVPPRRVGANFQAWRSGRGGPKYPVSVQPITFSRAIDSASIQLLQYCINCTSFDSATLVKRKSTGTGVAGEPYLRMDFVGVLITDVSWSNDDPVKETCKFISRAITVQYRPQLPDGSLGAARHGFWSMNPWEREVTL